MHNETNVFGNIFHIIMNTDKTMDNIKARLDLAEWCDRFGLELKRSHNGTWVKPKASYCLSKDQKMEICKWLGIKISRWIRVKMVKMCEC
jgi:hypothetical protein